MCLSRCEDLLIMGVTRMHDSSSLCVRTDVEEAIGLLKA